MDRDLSPLCLSLDNDLSPLSPIRHAPAGNTSSDTQSDPPTSVGEIATEDEQDVKHKCCQKDRRFSKQHSISPHRFSCPRSKSPSPSPAVRKKSFDLSRSNSFSTAQQDHRAFREADLIIGDVLGQGFFGLVFKVTHIITGEHMVLKELHNFDENAQKSFLREVAMLRNLSHPCVLKFMGVLFRDRKLNLVTEFIEGGTLSDLLLDKSINLTWKQRIEFAKDIAAGMSYLHSMNIIHRDLNSQNCLVRKDQTVVVADFGLAKTIHRHDTYQWLFHPDRQKDDDNAAESSVTERSKKRKHSRQQRGTIVGNPYWMAPEMMMKGVYDEKVDVFSYGIIVCETIARVSADPDYLPRSFDFGLNVEAFHRQFCAEVPEPYLMLAVICSHIEPDTRPSFDQVHILCDALLLHVEHGVIAPAELQGSAVDFYHNMKRKLYGQDYKDMDSSIQARKNQSMEKALNAERMSKQSREINLDAECLCKQSREINLDAECLCKRSREINLDAECLCKQSREINLDSECLCKQSREINLADKCLCIQSREINLDAECLCKQSRDVNLNAESLHKQSREINLDEECPCIQSSDVNPDTVILRNHQSKARHHRNVLGLHISNARQKFESPHESRTNTCTTNMYNGATEIFKCGNTLPHNNNFLSESSQINNTEKFPNKEHKALSSSFTVTNIITNSGTNDNVVATSVPSSGTKDNVTATSLPSSGTNDNVVATSLPSSGTNDNVVATSPPSSGTNNNVVATSPPSSVTDSYLISSSAHKNQTPHGCLPPNKTNKTAVKKPLLTTKHASLEFKNQKLAISNSDFTTFSVEANKYSTKSGQIRSSSSIITSDQACTINPLRKALSSDSTESSDVLEVQRPLSLTSVGYKCQEHSEYKPHVVSLPSSLCRSVHPTACSS